MTYTKRPGETQAEYFARCRQAFAKSDLRLARKERQGMCICQTNRGNIELTYDPATEVYTAVGFNTGEVMLVAAAGPMREFIAASYILEAA
jgi:hypothetical protein